MPSPELGAPKLCNTVSVGPLEALLDDMLDDDALDVLLDELAELELTLDDDELALLTELLDEAIGGL